MQGRPGRGGQGGMAPPVLKPVGNLRMFHVVGTTSIVTVNRVNFATEAILHMLLCYTERPKSI